MSDALEVWTAEKLRVIKQQIAPKATDDELEYFAAVCRRTGLDPAAKQIYCLHRDTYNPDTKKKEPKMTIQTAIDGFRVIAERSRLYRGQTKKEWCGPDGEWKDVWLSDKPPAAARVGVHKEGFSEPLYAVAHWREYRQGYNNDGQFKLSGLWATMPAGQLAKCAESLALRAAFPNDLSGLYTDDEFPEAGSAVSAAGNGDHSTPTRPALQAAADNSNVDPASGEVKQPVEVSSAPRTVAPPGVKPADPADGQRTTADNTRDLMEKLEAPFADADASFVDLDKVKAAINAKAQLSDAQRQYAQTELSKSDIALPQNSRAHYTAAQYELLMVVLGEAAGYEAEVAS